MFNNIWMNNQIAVFLYQEMLFIGWKKGMQYWYNNMAEPK